jgi:anti-sigma B factor antagonist
MGFTIEPVEGGQREFRLVGELDLATAAGMSETLSASADQEGDLRLDVSGLSFIDSSGIRALLMVAERLGSRGRLILVNPSEAVHRTLLLVGIDRAENLDITKD